MIALFKYYLIPAAYVTYWKNQEFNMSLLLYCIKGIRKDKSSNYYYFKSYISTDKWLLCCSRISKWKELMGRKSSWQDLKCTNVKLYFSHCITSTVILIITFFFTNHEICRSFLNYLESLSQSESWCPSFQMKKRFHSHAI